MSSVPESTDTSSIVVTFSGVEEPEWLWLVPLFPAATFDLVVGPCPLLLNGKQADGPSVAFALLSSISSTASFDLECTQWIHYCYGHQVERLLKSHPEDFAFVFALLDASLSGRTYLVGPREDAFLLVRLVKRIAALTPTAAKEKYPRVSRWAKHLVALWSLPATFFQAIEANLSTSIPVPKAPAAPQSNKREAVKRPAALPAPKDPFELVDLRIGRIVSIAKHPEADRLYVEQVDFGPAIGTRTVVSGLVHDFSEDHLVNRQHVFVCNLKPASLCKVVSQGMLLVGKDGQDKSVLKLPMIDDSLQPGDRVVPFGQSSSSEELLPVVKSKDWDTVKERLVVSDGHAAILVDGKPQNLTARGKNILVPGIIAGILS